MKKFLTRALFSLLLFCSWQSSFADVQSVKVTNFSELTNSIIAYVYKPFLSFITDTWLGFDLTLLPSLLQAEQDKNQAQIELQNNLIASTNAVVDLDFSDPRVKEENINDLQALAAGDDNPSTAYRIVDYYRNIFTYGSKAAEDAETQENIKRNSVFNVENFLGPLQYTEDQQKVAQTYYRYLTNIGPWPELIRLGEKFYVPYVKGNLGNGKTLIELPRNYSLKQLKTDLAANADYRAYRLNYRTQVAARTLFLSNILNAYLRRIQSTKQNGVKKSEAQLEYEQIYNPFKKDYYEKMAKATPATIQFEILMTLHKLNQQLFEIKQHQERLSIMNSVRELKDITAVTDPMKIRKIGQLIYCTIPEHKNEDDCKTTGATIPGMPSLPGM